MVLHFNALYCHWWRNLGHKAKRQEPSEPALAPSGSDWDNCNPLPKEQDRQLSDIRGNRNIIRGDRNDILR